MLSQTDLKTLVPSLVMSGVLVYEAITGNAVSSHVQDQLVNGILIGAGYMVTLWGIWKNHQKSATKVETTPPKIPPDPTSGVQIQPTLTDVNSVQTNPIVTQQDLNKQIGG
jgi:hypothetical protein